MADLGYRESGTIPEAVQGIMNTMSYLTSEINRRPDARYLRELFHIVLVDAFDLVFHIESLAAQAQAQAAQAQAAQAQAQAAQARAQSVAPVMPTLANSAAHAA